MTLVEFERRIRKAEANGLIAGRTCAPLSPWWIRATRDGKKLALGVGDTLEQAAEDLLAKLEESGGAR